MRPWSQMKNRFTSRFGRGRTRTTTFSRVSRVTLHPCEQPVQMDAALSSSHARALCRKSLDKREPTGHRSTTLPGRLPLVQGLPAQEGADRAQIDDVARPG